MAADQQDLEKNSSEPDRIRLLVLRQEISDHILLATQELTSVLAEIEVKRARANELKNYLEQGIDRRVTRLTVYSVLAGALSTVVSGTLAIFGADDVYIETPAMAGAVLSGYWAIRALGVRRSRIPPPAQPPDRYSGKSPGLKSVSSHGLAFSHAGI